MMSLRSRVLRRAATSLLAGACALAVGAGCTGEGGGAPQAVTVGKPAPAYAGQTLAGDSVTLASLRGRTVLLNVWATWCTPCRTEIPALQRLHDRFGANGLEVVGVSVDADDDEDKIRSFMIDFRMTYPVWRDPAERVSATFLVIGIPATFLVGPDGTLLFRHIGPVTDTDPKLLAAIEQGLGTSR